MTTRIYVCKIEVDEDESDFYYDAALIEESINKITGCKVIAWDTEED